MAGKVKPIPEGMHSISPSLVVRGAAKAIDFYKKAFGAVERARMPAPDGQSIWHAEIQIGDSIFMMADENVAMGNKSPQSLGDTPITLHLYVEDADATFKRAVDAGAKVKMPMDDAFWGDRYGQVTDPFGFHWSLATHVKDMSPEEMRKAGEEFAKKMGNP
jgi:PhnB protein